MPRREDRRREITRLLAQRETQGLSLRDLSERSGIPIGTLSWWSYRLRQESKPAFVELQLSSNDNVGIAGVATSTPDIVVRHPDGLCVELRGDAADRLVEHVLSRLNQCS